jgi:hypothetical protein
MPLRRKVNPKSIVIPESVRKVRASAREITPDSYEARTFKLVRGFTPTQARARSLMRKSRKIAYLNALSFRKTQIPKQLFDSARIKVVEKKLRLLFNKKGLVFFRRINSRGKYDRYSLSGVPLRYERMDRFLAELSKKNMFVGKEAGVFTHSGVEQELSTNNIDSKELTPTQRFSYLQGEGMDFADFRGDYDCRVFFSQKGFAEPHSDGEGINFLRAKAPEHTIGYLLWGRVPKSNSVLAVQVFHSNPDKLIELTKAMIKRRPHDPIAIFDAYGNLFYP